MAHKKSNPAAPTSPPAAPATPQDAEAPVRVLRKFRLVFNAVKTHFQQVEKQAGIGGAQLWALHVVGENPGSGVGHLARALDVRQPTASNLVKSLSDQGLIEVRKEGKDRRAVQLYLLPPGRALLDRAPGPFSGILPQALAALDAETLANLERDLHKLISVIGADERAANIPLAQL